jgi:putative ABC transport system permease protein
MRWYRRFFRRGLAEQQLDAELRFHLDQRVAGFMAAGMSPEEARRRARLEFGGLDQVKEECRDVGGSHIIESLLQDLRYGVRQLRRNPGFTSVAVLTLALGIGANTAIFSLVNAALLRPLPYRDPSRLVYISEFWPRETPVQTATSPDFANWSEHDQLFDGLAAYGGGAEVNLTSDRGPERVHGVTVTADFFSVLGVQPLLGRAVLPEEDRPGGPHVVLLSHELWRERFGSNPSIIGKSVKLDGVLYSVIGVTRAGFRFPDDQFKAQLFLPMVVARVANWSSPDYFRLLRPIARLKPGVTVEQARAELTALVHRTAAQEPPQFVRMRAGMEVRVTTLGERLAAPARPILLIFSTSVALLLIMSCVNVAGLQLARGAVRQKEVAVRAALGASRRRLAGQLLAESLVVATLALPVALLTGSAGIRALRALGPPQIPHLESVRLDPAVLLFTTIVAMMTAILSGLSPALFASRTQPNEALQQGGRLTPGQAQHRVRGALVTAEVAMAVVLLVGAGLLARSFIHLVFVDPGFDPHHLLTLRLSLSGAEYSKPEQRAAFFGRLLERLNALPGVQSVAAGSGLPILGWGSLRGTNVEGRPRWPVGLRPDVPCDVVSTQYFRTLHIPLLAGRDFDEQDRQGAPEVAIVNRAFVQQFFPNENALGKHVGGGAPTGAWREIVGVVGNVRQLGLDHAESPEIYIPYVQEPSSDMSLVLRASGDPLASVEFVRAAVREVDAHQPVYDIATMEQRLSGSIAPQRFNMLLVGLFAVVALGLGALGIYGVLAYSVTQRTREIAIRMALGAERGNVLKLVVSQGIRLVAFGLGIGVPGSAAMARLLRSQLFGVGPDDPATLMAVAAILTFVAGLACYLPARRATRIDPMAALRIE